MGAHGGRAARVPRRLAASSRCGLLNAHIDYAAHFPPEYEAGHTAGLRLLRVAARVRAEQGRDAVGPLYEAIGARIFDTSREVDPLSASGQASRQMLEPLLTDAGLPTELAEALDDATYATTRSGPRPRKR